MTRNHKTTRASQRRLRLRLAPDIDRCASMGPCRLQRLRSNVRLQRYRVAVGTPTAGNDGGAAFRMSSGCGRRTPQTGRALSDDRRTSFGLCRRSLIRFRTTVDRLIPTISTVAARTPNHPPLEQGLLGTHQLLLNWTDRNVARAQTPR
jgi:hypothetical protein